MEQLHGRARLAHKYIHVTISRFQTHFPDQSKQYGLFRIVAK